MLWAMENTLLMAFATLPPCFPETGAWRLRGLLLASSLAPVRAAAPANPAAERIREGEVKQTQLRNEAQQLVEQLDGMIGEYERNGLAGEDANRSVEAVVASCGQQCGAVLRA